MKKLIDNSFKKGIKIQGFTLVELIIVITILAILATIAFISFQDYTKDARDWNRLATIKNIEKWLTLFQLKSWNYPEPDRKINIEASWSILSYQWKIWENVSKIINMNTLPTDPVDEIEYMYSTNITKTKYQLLTYMEWDEYISFLPQTYANDVTKRYPKTFWDNIWIILNEDNTIYTSSMLETHSWITNYKIYFQDNEVIISSGNTIFSNIYNRREDLIKNKDIAILDNSLVGYWDMESVCENWECWALNDGKLKDFSKYKNHGTCYNWTSSWACWDIWPQIVDWNWKTWKAMSFDGVNDQVTIDYNNIYITWSLSIFVKFKANTYWNCKKNYTTLANYSVNIISSMKWDNDYQWPFWIEFRCNWFLDFYITKTGLSLALFWRTTDYEVSNFWYYFSKYNKQTWKGGLYLNGVFKNSSDTTTWPNTSLFWWINRFILWSGRTISGADYWGYFDGLIDEVRIYNRALSDTEIKELYHATK